MLQLMYVLQAYALLEREMRTKNKTKKYFK